MNVLVQLFLKEDFPNEDDMMDFIAKVQADYENPNYHLYCVMYEVICPLLI